MNSANVVLLNCKQLAAALNWHPGSVTAMRAAGYEFEYGTRTTKTHALRWLKANPSFRTTSYYAKARQRRATGPSAAPVGRSAGAAPTNGRGFGAR